MEPPLPQVACQARLESDVRGPHPGSTAGYHHQSQALGGPDRCPAVPSVARCALAMGEPITFMEPSTSVWLLSCPGCTEYIRCGSSCVPAVSPRLGCRRWPRAVIACLPVSAHRTPELDVQDGGPQLLCAIFGFVSVAWRCGPAFVD